MEDPKQKTPSFVDIVEEVVEEIDVLEERAIEEAQADAFEQPDAITIDIDFPVSDGALLLLELCLSYQSNDLKWLVRQLQQELKDREDRDLHDGSQQDG